MFFLCCTFGHMCNKMLHERASRILLLPNGALSPSYFPLLPPPSTLSSLPSRSFPPALSPSYFPHHTFPLHPSCRRFNLAPSQRDLPRLFPTASPPSTLSSLPSRSFPTALSPKLFPTVSRPSTLSTLPSRSFPTELFQAFSHGFPSVHPVVASVSLHPRQSELNENPSIRDAFGNNNTERAETPTVRCKS